MPNFRYRALTQNGEIVNGSLSAPSAAEVARRIEYLGLVPIETAVDDGSKAVSRMAVSFFNRPRAADVTLFTRDLALLLAAGARLDDGLELMVSDVDTGRLRPTIAKIRASVLAGEGFAEALSHHPQLFPPIYQALVRVGEAAGSLGHILEMLANERTRSEALQRKFTDALHYPAFVLAAAGVVLLFFIIFVLPQFAPVLRDFNAKTDLVIETFFNLSDFLRANGTALLIGAALLIVTGWQLLQRGTVRAAIATQLSKLPIASTVFNFYRTALFCRNLGTLLGNDVALPATLRILIDIMSVTGSVPVWTAMADRVRHGGKLSEALAASTILPPMAIRMLRLGEETGQLPLLAARVAEFYEVKLQRSLDRVVGIVGPLAIVIISIVVGGLIVSVMTALLSVTQVVG